MARQPKTRQPKAKFDPRCVVCKTPYLRMVHNGKLTVRPRCSCQL